MSDLQPCPFCGEPPHVAANLDTIIIECHTVNCPASPITTGDLLIDAFKAAAAWNRRVIPAALEAQIAAADRLASATLHGSTPSVLRKLAEAYTAARVQP